MTQQKRQRLMFAILIVSVLFGIVMRPWERPAKQVSTPDNSTSMAAAAVSAPIAVTDIQFVSDWPDRDPFTRRDETVDAGGGAMSEMAPIGEPSIALQGIFTIDGQMACVIDSKTCVVGSVIAGWTIDEIDAQGVWVSQGGERRFVQLP